MSDIFLENRLLAQDPLVTLFALDYTTSLTYNLIPGVQQYYFTNNTGGNVTFAGITYLATGCSFASDTITIDGKIPRASLDVDLQNSTFRPIINHYQLNIRGARLTVIYTRQKYLAEPSPILNQHYEQEIWYADNYSSIKKAVASLDLTIGIGLESQTAAGGVLNTNVS